MHLRLDNHHAWRVDVGKNNSVDMVGAARAYIGVNPLQGMACTPSVSCVPFDGTHLKEVVVMTVCHCRGVMAELVRIFHDTDVETASKLSRLW